MCCDEASGVMSLARVRACVRVCVDDDSRVRSVSGQVRGGNERLCRCSSAGPQAADQLLVVAGDGGGGRADASAWASDSVSDTHTHKNLETTTRYGVTIDRAATVRSGMRIGHLLRLRKARCAPRADPAPVAAVHRGE